MSVVDDPAMDCVEEYFQCLGRRLDEMPQNVSKSKVRAFLTSREILEESHYEFIQRHVADRPPAMPSAPSSEKVNAFLSSRYKPRLDLGIAAKAGYWNFDHSAFKEIKDFLRSL
jgi:hypothetical protein